jgi:signal transduction histidine kinase
MQEEKKYNHNFHPEDEEAHMTDIFKAAEEGMAECFKSSRHRPDVKEALVLLALTSIGLAGNHLSIEMFFGVHFLFGSIATMIAVRTSGILWGTLVGIVIGSYSYVLWGHPYAIIIFGLEAFVVGVITCRLKKDNIISYDLGYWLFVGAPLVWVFYSYQLGMPGPAVTLVALKQMVNGITNVVLASVLLQFTPMTRWVELKVLPNAQKERPMHSAISTLLAIFILLPMLAVTVISGQFELKKNQENMAQTVKDKAGDARRELASTLNYYSTVLASSLVFEPNKDNRASWESTVKNFGKHIIPGLLNTEILSADGEILSSYPVQRSGISLYANQIHSITPDSHYLSSVHVDGDLEGLHFTMIFPIPGGYFLAASFSPKIFEEQLTRISPGKQHIELLDGQDYIAASSGENDLSGFVQGINPHHLLPSNADLPAMVRWKLAYWKQTESFMGNNDWIIRVATPMAKSIDLLQADYINKLLMMLIIFAVSLLLVPLVSRALSSPLKELTLAADQFAYSIERTDVIWPTSNIREVNSLVDQLQEFVQTINEKQLALSRIRVEQERERKEAAAQIIQASKLATLGEMSTSVAHELNQPLNVIRMAAGNVRRKISKGTADPEYLTDKLQRIEQQTARAAVIISHMRMFGRKAEEDPEPIDPRKVVTNALDLMGEQLRLAGIEIVTELAEDCSSILGHTIQMEQVLLNLLTNARDAVAERDGKAKITLRVFEDGKGVHITSEDTGGGIPEDVLPRIFEPFYTTKEMGKGMGLGLSDNYGIIREMNGTIVAENIGDGSRFTITLPSAPVYS